MTKSEKGLLMALVVSLASSYWSLSLARQAREDAATIANEFETYRVENSEKVDSINYELEDLKSEVADLTNTLEDVQGYLSEKQ